MLSPAGRHLFGFGRSLRISRNSLGPLMSRRLRLACSSAVASLSPMRSISRAANSDALAVALLSRRRTGRELARPSSTKRRIASDRDSAPCVTVHWSIRRVNSADSRIALWRRGKGARGPVASCAPSAMVPLERATWVRGGLRCVWSQGPLDSAPWCLTLYRAVASCALVRRPRIIAP